MTDFDLFMQKATARQDKLNKPFELEVNGYGKVTFIRPKTKQILDYMDKTSSAVVLDSNENVVEQNIYLLEEAARELVYLSCPMLQEKELQERLNIKDPLQTPSECFGIQETLTLANNILEKVEGIKLATKVNEEIKN